MANKVENHKLAKGNTEQVPVPTDIDGLIKMAIAEARKTTVLSLRDPYVGVVALCKDRRIIAAHRENGSHGEYIALIRKGRKAGICLKDSTVFTTLEPCTRRPDKIPCAERLVRAGVKHVYVGMVDPNPIISGDGIRHLQKHNIQVDLFPVHYVKELELINEVFTRYQTPEKVAIQAAAISSLPVCTTDTRGVLSYWNAPMRALFPDINEFFEQPVMNFIESSIRKWTPLEMQEAEIAQQRRFGQELQGGHRRGGFQAFTCVVKDGKPQKYLIHCDPVYVNDSFGGTISYFIDVTDLSPGWA